MMQAMKDIPDDKKALATMRAQAAKRARDAGDHSEAAMHAMYAFMAIASACPEFWLVIDAIAAGDFAKADELIA